MAGGVPADRLLVIIDIPPVFKIDQKSGTPRGRLRRLDGIFFVEPAERADVGHRLDKLLAARRERGSIRFDDGLVIQLVSGQRLAVAISAHNASALREGPHDPGADHARKGPGIHARPVDLPRLKLHRPLDAAAQVAQKIVGEGDGSWIAHAEAQFAAE